MACDYCIRAPPGAYVGEAFWGPLHLIDGDACELAARTCLSWWQKKDEEIELDDIL